MAGLAFDLSRLPAGWTPMPERVQSSLTDSDRSTQQTVGLMCRHIREACAKEHIKDIASRLGRWGRGADRAHHVAWDVFWFCKHAVKFVLDEHAVLGLLGEVDQVDFLISPPVLMAMRRPAGDCDDFTMLACSLLQLNGVEWEIVTVATDRADPRRWSHVYLRAILPDGRRMALDPTNGPYPGWEPPAYDVHRKQFWNMDAQPVDGPESIQDSRMHGYQMGRGLSGDGLDWTVPIENAIVTPPVSLTNSAGYADVLTAQSGGPSGPAFNWNSLISNLSNVGGRLATIALTPKGGFVTTDRFGNTVVSNTGLPVASAGSGSLIFYLALGVGVLLAVKAVSK